MKSLSFKKRIRIVSVFVVLIAGILIFKLFFIQIVHKNFYAEKADRQYETAPSNLFNRGSIFFSNKNSSLVAVATILSGFKIALNTKRIKNPQSLYQTLKPYLKISRDTFIRHASKKNDPYEEVAIHLNKDQADKIRNLKLPGVSIFKDNWRFYPGGSSAAQTIGFLAYKGNDKIGQYGLERYYQDVLSKPKNQVYINFFAEVFSNIKNTLSKTENNQGSIITTIEPTVQHVLESELSDALTKWKADLAGGIIINPQNGEIYAMASIPSFDLNNFQKVSDVGVFRNTNIEDVFEFGSVIKPLVMAGALDANILTPKTMYVDKGEVTVDNKKIYNFDKRGRGRVDMQTVLDQSLNTGMVFVQSKMGHDLFRSYMKSYGIGKRTGIDLPNETYGLISNLNSPRNIEYANAAFGQGIALTPIEAVRAFSSLANGGNLIVPHLVKQIQYDDGLLKTLNYPITSQEVIKKKTSETITRMLVHVFDSYYSGADKFKHYSIAAKTGTAQIAKSGGGGYYSDRYLHSFFGYFPAYNPKFLVFLFLKNPKDIKYSSQTLIPPFINIARFLLNYYNVPPDR